MSDYCEKCGEKIRIVANPFPELCGLCMDDKLNEMNKLTWTERLPMLSINPDAATRHDVARMAAELMECRKCILDLRAKISEAVSSLIVEP